MQCASNSTHDKYTNSNKYWPEDTYGEDEVTLDDVSDEGEHGTVEMKRKEWRKYI